MQANLTATLAPIRARFVLLLQERQSTIQQKLDIAFEDPKQAEPALSDIEAVLHKIAGTAGTLGFDELGEKARQTEYLIIGLNGEQGDRRRDVYLEIITFLEYSIAFVNAQA
jgi:HPt (histidine-containing phosphotransfer) domain-containing protein